MTPSARERRSLLLARVHAATGIVPLGAFLVLHVWSQSRAIQGPLAYERVVRKTQSIPGVLLLEGVGIYLPLLFHAAYGILLSVRSGSGPARPERPKAWSRPMQRLTGVLTLLFVGYHLWELPVARILGRLRGSDLFPSLVDSLSSTTSLGVPLGAVAYLVGLASSAYHFANGLSGFLLDFGLVTSERTGRLASVACTMFGTLVFLVGASTVFYYATGSPWP